MKVNIKTFGCAMNYRDSENIAGILVNHGYKITNLEEADVVIVNSCGVKSTTQNRVMSYINSVPKNKNIYVGGCLPRILDLKKFPEHVNGFFDVNSISSIIKLISTGEKFIFSETKENRLNKEIIRKNREIAIIPIAQGCLGSCNFCLVKFTRGTLKSYNKEEIIKEVKKAVKDDCKKICLTAQDSGCWGYDFNERLPDLLNEVIKIGGDFKIRLGMANPNFVLKYLDELIEIYKSNKMIKFLHIPVQSGSNKVLVEMGRNYKIEDFKAIMKKFRGEIPEINISTDIIVGYPTETEEDFQETLKLIKEIKPEVLNISKFAPRPKTKAALLKQLSTQEIKRRSVILTKEFNKIKN